MKLAVIPARGGSKRIPRKNLRPFAGRPIIAYSIDAALESALFEHVVVSTDDPEIAALARSLGASTPFQRPAELSGDFSGTNAVVRHAIEWFGLRGQAPDYVCCIYATAPFVRADDLRRGYETLRTTSCAYAFSVTSFAFPIQRALRINTDGRVEAMYPQFTETRSQDLEEAWHDAGQFYWGRATAFAQDVPLFSPASTPVVLPRHRVQDIDTLEDWRRAELMYAALLAEDPHESRDSH